MLDGSLIDASMVLSCQKPNSLEDHVFCQPRHPQRDGARTIACEEGVQDLQFSPDTLQCYGGTALQELQGSRSVVRVNEV
jgi:hypothetical protein